MKNRVRRYRHACSVRNTSVRTTPQRLFSKRFSISDGIVVKYNQFAKLTRDFDTSRKSWIDGHEHARCETTLKIFTRKKTDHSPERHGVSYAETVPDDFDGKPTTSDKNNCCTCKSAKTVRPSVRLVFSFPHDHIETVFRQFGCGGTAFNSCATRSNACKWNAL